MAVSIKLEGINDVKKLFHEKGVQIIQAGRRVEEKHISKIVAGARGKIHNITGEMASVLKGEVSFQGKTAVVARVGSLGATKEQAIAWNSYEYGHAAPGDAGGVKTVQGKAVLRSTLAEDKSSFVSDMKEEIRKVIES